MVKRNKQKIISPFGYRHRKDGGKIIKEFHKGVDLRSWDKIIWKRQPVIFPQDCQVIRVGYQDKWGWNVVAKSLEGGFEFKFIHLKKPEVKENEFYNEGEIIGYTTRTKYMIENNFGEHLHLEIRHDGSLINPIQYFDMVGIKYG